MENIDAKTSAAAGKSSLSWKKVMIGGVPGLILGTAGIAAAEEYGDFRALAADALESDELNLPEDVGVASEISEDMSFGEAFAAAREELGPGGVFTWHGNVYNTFTQEEWAALQDEASDDSLDSVYTDADPIVETAEDNNDNGEDEPVEATAEEDIEQEQSTSEAPVVEEAEQAESVDQPVNETPAEAPVAAEPEVEGNFQTDIIADSEVEVLNSGSTLDENGNTVNIVSAQVDGHASVMLDADNDGFIDVVHVDANDNGVVDEGEVMDVTKSDLHLNDLNASSEVGTYAPEDTLYADNPDYTNDADASDFV